MSNNLKVLVVDDEETIHLSIKRILKKYDVDVINATSTSNGITAIEHHSESILIAFIDQRLKQANGIIESGVGLVPHIRKISPNTIVVMISGCEDVSVLKSWMDHKIDKYAYKPLNPSYIEIFFEQALENHKNRKLSFIDDKIASSTLLEKFKMIGISRELSKAVNIAMKSAQSNSQLVTLILGESGTGKELIARGIHENSLRNIAPFRPVNCASFGGSESLLESQLFGHVKGAFTGADSRKVGIFEDAGKGTVFLDEIHCLSINSQEKLLRVIQERKIRPVGSSIEIPIEAKIIVAAKPNLFQMASERDFLPDLFYRLNGFDIALPSLRERPKDILILADAFLKKYRNNENAHFHSDVLNILKNHDWPGNVRELETAVERACEVCESDEIGVQDLPANLSTIEFMDSLEGIVPLDILKDEYNKKLTESMISALKKTKYNISKASRLLKTSREDFRYKMSILGIEKENEKHKEGFINKA